MTASQPSLSTLQSRLAAAGSLSFQWLRDLWADRPEDVERLICEAFDLDPADQTPGDLLRQLTNGGAAQFDHVLLNELPATLLEGGLLQSAQTVGGSVEIEQIFPDLSSTAGEGSNLLPLRYP